MKPIGNRTGNRMAAVVILLLAMGANLAHSAVTATVDRNLVALGDTVRLTITANDDEDIDEGKLRTLQNDFDILRRSTSSNTSIINGEVSHTRQMIVDLAPRREGNLQIPSMRFGQSTTQAITIAVGPASDTPGDGQSVVFEAEVSAQEVYVQGQVILTLRVQQAVNLEGRSISPLELDNAFVKPLEQRSFQRVINGRPWQVDEIRYAIFPEHSGTLEIPAQIFSGRIDRGRRSFFDLGGGGQLVRRTTQPLTIKVLPKPANYPAADWLPAEKLTLQETWSTPPEQLQVGESATRTIRIVGEGLQGAQLPPILFTAPDGLKYYPDQPAISEEEIAGGLEGIREDSAAVVPTRAGTYVIPEIRIPWWNTTTQTLEHAVLPQRQIVATGAGPAAATATAPTSGEVTGDTATPPVPAAVNDLNPNAAPGETSSPLNAAGIWQLVAAISTLGWLITLLYLWRSRGQKPRQKAATSDNPSESQAFKAFINACERSDPGRTRAAVIAWAATFMQPAATSLEQIASELGDETLKQQLEELDTALYRPGNDSWNGSTLAACARRVRKQIASARKSGPEASLQLYPENR